MLKALNQSSNLLLIVDEDCLVVVDGTGILVVDVFGITGLVVEVSGRRVVGFVVLI